MLTIDTEKCTRCMKCEAVCPTLSINIENNTISSACISCYHCQAVCESEAIEPQQTNLGYMQPSPIKAEDFEKLIQQRRTYRNYKSIPIPDQVLEAFFTKLRFSPTASNSQTLQFSVIQAPEVLKEVNDLSIKTLLKAFSAINSISTPLLKLFKGRKQIDKLLAAKQRFIAKVELKPDTICYNAPILIVIHTKQSPIGMPIQDASIWTGMASLYAEILGLGTCINGYIVRAGNTNPILKKRLGVPKNHQILTTLLMGYPDVEYKHLVERNNPMVTYIKN